MMIRDYADTPMIHDTRIFYLFSFADISFIYAIYVIALLITFSYAI